jgi:glycosyltransferase involved in cell wall biosynthesis
MGAPTVAADIPACREVGLDAATYYAPGEDESLAERLVELLKTPERTRALASRSAARGTQFTWQRNARAVRDSLLKAVA